MMLYAKSRAIRAVRQQINITRHAIALKAGLSKNTMYRIESADIYRVNHLHAKAIARALGCKVEDIFTPISRGA